MGFGEYLCVNLPGATGCPWYFWVCLWGCFQMRLTFASSDWVKQIFLPSVCGPHQSTQGLHRIKAWVKTNFLSLPYCLWTGTLIFSCLLIQTWTRIDLHHQLFCFSGPSDLNWNYTNGSSGSELLSLHNCVSQLLNIHRCALYMFIYMSVYTHIYTCILLVMFLWRTLPNTVCPSSTSFIYHVKTYFLRAYYILDTVQLAWIKSACTLPASEASFSQISRRPQMPVTYTRHRFYID